MLQRFKKYKAVIRFIVIFLGAYLILSLVYNWYLDTFVSGAYQPDYITKLVALQSEAVVSSMGYQSRIIADTNSPIMNLWVNGEFIARIIEGCNSISIIILFVAFMLAFFGRKRTTLLFILAGMVLIYAINVLRIAVLSIAIYELPQYSHFLHKIIFPLIIYGSVFILWVLWIRIFTKENNQ